MDRVADKVAFITGGARGLGRSHALRLAAEGADIVVFDLCKEAPGIDYAMSSRRDLDDTVKQVRALGRRAIGVVGDIRDQDALNTAAARAVSELGSIDILVANAGVTAFANGWELTEQQWDAVVDTNLKGTWQTCKAVVPHMIEGGRGGSIVLIGSAAGQRGQANLVHYSATKHGLVGIVRSLAGEVAPHSIRVNIVHPTAVDTPMLHNDYTYTRYIDDPEERNREGASKVMSNMNMLPTPWVEAVDVSNAVLFLASDEARFITAIELPVDAGAGQN